jgi:rubrerythrin
VEELRHAKEEGIEFFFLHAPVEIFTDADGNVRGMKVEEMQLGEPDEKGRRKPVPTGRTKDLDCDTVIYALGTKANPIVTQSTPGLALNKWGNIAADDGAETSTQATNLPGVFAGGDIVTGGATVILAMGAGRRAARSIGAYLAGGKKWPLTAEDVAAFQPPAVEPSPAGPHAGAIAVGAQAPAHACPKCHRAIEPGEDYVCCGGQELRWRCKGCGKVSEGFAFPYGMCPACGGALELAEATPAEGFAPTEAVRRAFEIELGGMAFYRQAAREAQDPTMRELFARFEGMEQEHMATLSRRYHVEIPAPAAAFPVERAAMYTGTDSRPDDPENLFRLAIAFEKRAVAYFRDRIASTPPASPERKLYMELAAEEEEHVALLTTERERWAKGRRGIL